MSPATGAAGVTLVAIALYAVFGGADFGGGVWDLLASGPRARQQRATITHAIGPVWEAHHVWLIFALVTLFTCFPPAYADIAAQLNAPLTLALLGIVLRGAAFVFRNFGEDVPALAQGWTVVFGAASIIAPFFLGDAVGAIAAGDYAWTSPFALSVGLFAVALCAQVAAVFLVRETREGALQDDFRRRAVAATLAVWVLGALPTVLAWRTVPQLISALHDPAAQVAVVLAFVFGLVVLALVVTGSDLAARIAVGAEVVAVLGGWFGGQAPAVVPGRWTLATAAAPDATLTAYLIAAAIGSVLLIPAMLLLYTVFKGPGADLGGS